MIGQTVGNFEIIAALGKGGMGEVWLAQQKALKTKVAIKVLGASISTNTTHITRFRNEAIAVSGIPHSGIVKMFDTGDLPDGRAYLVMEYLEGETLSNRIKRMGRLDVALIADFGRQIASVLDATHGAGITHRDLKPDNIFVVRDAELLHGERIKILDFGIAKLDTTVGPRMTAASVSSIGTPNYMSPEQWHSLAESDWRTDAYALGCVAYEMACGQPPFVAESRVEICAMHLGEKPPVPSSRVPGIPQIFDHLVARLLEKEPVDRPTMRDAIAVFTSMGQGEGVALSTLPPKGMLSPFAANASSSMQYKMTPRAMPTERGQSEPRVREDATPVANMSLQFKPTPVQGFESQTNMRARTDVDAASSHRASQPMLGASSAAKPRRTGLFVVLGVLVLVVVIAIIAGVAGSSEPVTSSGSAVASGSGSGSSGSASVAVGSGSAGSGSAGSGSASEPIRRKRVAELPPLRHEAPQPVVSAPLALEVCIDKVGSVDSVERVDRAPLAKPIEAIISNWEFQPPADAVPVCGPVTIAVRGDKPAPKVDTRPERMSDKMVNDGLGRVQEQLMDCDRGDAVQTFQITVTVANGAVKSVKVVPSTPAVVTGCIQRALRAARFTSTRTETTLPLTIQFGR